MANYKTHVASYQQLSIQLKQHGSELHKYLTVGDFTDAILRSTPEKTRPVVMLCTDPECSKQKPRLEFIAPNNIQYNKTFAGKIKTILTYNTTH